MLHLSPCNKHLGRDDPVCVAIRHDDGRVATPVEIWAEIRRLEREVSRLQVNDPVNLPVLKQYDYTKVICVGDECFPGGA